MLAAVDLDGDLMRDRRKIRNVGTNRHLSAKLDPREAPITQQAPYQPLDISAVAPEGPRRVPLLAFTHPVALTRLASLGTLSSGAGEGSCSYDFALVSVM